MRTLAIGDIHGSYTALVSLIDAVALSPKDRLITLGDYVDRGPCSREVVDWLIDWSARGQLIPLLGNHEIMMIASRGDQDTYNSWMLCGGAETVQSYTPQGQDPSLENVPESHWQFFERCLPWYETDTHIFVHAGLVPTLTLDDQPEFTLFWERFEEPQPHQSGKTMVCGHTRQPTGIPVDLGHAVCIDTSIYTDGWLTCLDLKTSQIWQSNEKGEVRQSKL